MVHNILSVVSIIPRSHVNPIQEAQIRSMWGTGSALENTLARYVDPMEHIAYNPENTVNMTAAEARANIIALKDELTDREALRFLELTSSGESLDDAAKAKERLNDWLDGEALNVTTRWYEFRLDATCAMGHINLIDDMAPALEMLRCTFIRIYANATYAAFAKIRCYRNESFSEKS
ncbi:hypothetical protein D6C88_10501 [Aureobasidium pullulans]|nr:hypothetical protein D6C88_10501 [Aureobasidium pullulans]